MKIILVIIVCCIFAIAYYLKAIADNLYNIYNTLWYIREELKRL